MKHSKNGSAKWPVIALSTLGLAGAVSLTTWLNRKKSLAPLEKAIDVTSRIADEVKKKIDLIAHEAQSHLSNELDDNQANLSKLTGEFKEKIDAMTDQLKSGMRSLRWDNGMKKSAPVNEQKKS